MAKPPNFWTSTSCLASSHDDCIQSLRVYKTLLCNKQQNNNNSRKEEKKDKLLFLFAAYFFYLQRTFFICSVLFFICSVSFFVCSVSFLFAACPLWAIVHYTSQSFLPPILSFKGSCKHAQRIVERSHQHPHNR